MADTTLRKALGQLSEDQSDDERAVLRTMCERLIDMREFHVHLVEAYRRFIEEWNEAELGLPPVETYAKRLGAVPAVSARSVL